MLPRAQGAPPACLVPGSQPGPSPFEGSLRHGASRACPVLPLASAGHTNPIFTSPAPPRLGTSFGKQAAGSAWPP